MLKPAITVVTESWLNSSYDDTPFNIPNYSLYRDDRVNRRGGGVAVWIASNIGSVRLFCSYQKPANLDCVWLRVNPDITLCSCYIPPSLSVSESELIVTYLTDCIDEIKITNPDTKVIVCGDFNRLDCSTLQTNHNLRNRVSSATRNTAILDIILLDDLLYHEYPICTVLPPISSSDHNLVHLIGKAKAKPTERLVVVFDYRREHLARFHELLSQVDWSILYRAEHDIDTKCNVFYDLLKPALDAIPRKNVIISSKDKPWITPVTKLLIQRRWDAYRKRDFQMYNHYKGKVKDELRKAKCIWSKKVLNTKKGLWKLVNSHRKDSANTTSASPTDLNNYFGSIFQLPTEDIDNIYIDDREENVWCTTITPEEIAKSLLSLPEKSGGTDNIPVVLLKVGAHLLCKPLSHLFNLSVELKSVPKAWKTAKIIPVPKCRNAEVKEHRPISLLPVISKVLERCVLNRLSVTLYDKYGSNQYGFRKHSSTACAVISMFDDITRKWENSAVRAVSIISFDASKAFDTVPHDLLLIRLLALGLPTGFIKWYRSYLSNRLQYVSCNGSNSEVISVTSGVPQGAILSPAMFCLFTAPLDVVKENNSLYKYADDVALVIYHSLSDDDEESCRSEIENIKNWCLNNRIQLNDNKSSRLLLSKNGSRPSYACLSTIKEVANLNILGFILDSNFSWSSFINVRIKKASKNLYLLRKLKPVLSKKDLVLLHIALVQSHLDYGSPIYVGDLKFNDKLSIKKLVNRSHRIICGPLCKNNCLPDPDQQRQKLSAQLFKNALMINSHVLHSRLPVFLPSGRRLKVPPHTSNRRGSSFIPFMTVHYNQSGV